MSTVRSSIFCAAALAVAINASAQQAPRAAAPAPRKASATRTAEVPVIDGQLDDAAWRQATPITDFVQTEPSEGQTATEATEVRILYDDRAIYVAVMAFDSDPSHIVTSDSRRDSALSGQDSFQLIKQVSHGLQIHGEIR